MPTVSWSTTSTPSFSQMTTTQSATWTLNRLATPSILRWTMRILIGQREWPSPVIRASFFTTWTSWRHGPLIVKTWRSPSFFPGSVASKSLRSRKSTLYWCYVSQTISLTSIFMRILLLRAWLGRGQQNNFNDYLTKLCLSFTVALIFKDHSYVYLSFNALIYHS